MRAQKFERPQKLSFVAKNGFVAKPKGHWLNPDDLHYFYKYAHLSLKPFCTQSKSASFRRFIYKVGDLIFLYGRNSTKISHTLIYIDANFIIDSTGPGVEIRPFDGWYKRIMRGLEE